MHLETTESYRMQTLYVLAAALAPIVVLMLYVYFKDKQNPEPTGMLIKGLWFGVLSTFLSLTISLPMTAVGLSPEVQTNFLDCLGVSFFGASIPEELAKFFMFWLLIRKNKYFDEHLDGVVYAASVALGFAALENVLYLFDNLDDWVTVGITRALLAVPMHCGCGILMGYYYSLIHFNNNHSLWNKSLVLLVPIMIHGVYDTLLFYMQVEPELSIFLAIAVLWLCNKLRKRCSARIAELMAMGMAIKRTDETEYKY